MDFSETTKNDTHGQQMWRLCHKSSMGNSLNDIMLKIEFSPFLDPIFLQTTHLIILNKRLI